MTPEDFARVFDEDEDEDEPLFNDTTRRHLYATAEMLTDQLDEDLRTVIDAVGTPGFNPWSLLTWTSDYLPPAFAASYDAHFLRDFYRTVLTVIYKLGTTWTGLSCVAEELAMNALLEMAETLRILEQDAGKDVSDIDFDDLRTIAYYDTDFRSLFDPELDGIHHSDVGRYLGMNNLDRSHWFDPNPIADAPPHPLTWRSASNDLL